MCAVLPVPSGNLKHGFRPTRTVILPDYQGLGIGTKLSEAIGWVIDKVGVLGTIGIGAGTIAGIQNAGECA